MLLRGKAIDALIVGTWTVFENDFAKIINGDRSDGLKSGLDALPLDDIVEIKTIYREIEGT